MSSVARIGQGDNDYRLLYNASDLRIGSTINIFGRLIRLLRADEYTKEYYRQNFRVDDEDLKDIVRTHVLIILHGVCCDSKLPLFLQTLWL